MSDETTMTRKKYSCDNCDFATDNEEEFPTLAEVHRLWERLTPGCTVPDGECPECGAFVYEEGEQSFDSLTGHVRTAVTANVKVLVEHLPGVNPKQVVNDCWYAFEATLGRGDAGTIISAEITSVT